MVNTDILFLEKEKSFNGKFKSIGFLFAIGSLGYAALELLWRGRTHWSMGLAGGICFVVFGKIWDKIKNLRKIYIPLFGGIIITCVELVFGIVFNIFLKKQVWDYSNIPFNFMGQICALFSTLWGVLSIVFLPLAGKINKRLY